MSNDSPVDPADDPSRITIVRGNVADDYIKIYHFNVAVDGIVDAGSSLGIPSRDPPSSPRAVIKDLVVSEKLCSMRLGAIGKRLASVTFPLPNELPAFIGGVAFACGGTSVAAPFVEFRYAYEPDDWARPYSKRFLQECIAQACEIERTGLRVESDQQHNTTFERLCADVDAKATPAEELRRLSPLVARVMAQAESIALSCVSPDVLVTAFRFPTEVSAACQQYLAYFAQFLRDLGIQATAEIQGNSAGNVLFKVTPGDGQAALQQIRAALNVYLALPDSPDIDQISADEDVAVTQLQSNVMHLRAQLMLARATIEQKDATIAALRFMDAQRMQSPALSPPKQASEKEDVLGGIVSVGTFDTKVGLAVNVGQILRMLKRIRRPWK